MQRANLSFREIALASALLLALGAAVFGSHIVHGGFYSDDWAAAEITGKQPYGEAVQDLFEILGSKPLLAVLLPIPHKLFGSSTEPHIALAILLAVLTSVCFYAALRSMGLERLHSAIIAAFALLFPWSDTSRLWPTASLNNLAICFYLLGLIIAIRGLRRTGRRSIVLHIGAVLLYVMSVLTYEVTAAAALASVLVYIHVSSARRALSRWPLDLVGISAAVIYTAMTTVKNTAPAGDQLANAFDMARDGAALGASSFFPVESPRPLIASGLALLVLAALIVVRRRPRGDAASEELRRWLMIGGAAVVGVALSYVMFVPQAYWSPLFSGLENRVNILAALPMMVLVYSLTMIAGVLAFRSSPDVRFKSAAVALAMSALIASGYLVRLDDDKDAWGRAYTEERRVLAVMAKVLPNPPEGARIYTFGEAGQVAREVPIFMDTWDLNGAARLLWHDPSIQAYPAFSGAAFSCRVSSLEPLDLPRPNGRKLNPADPLANSPGSKDAYPRAPYGKAVFLDIRKRRFALIRNRSGCRSALHRFRPGPFELPRA